MPTRLPAKLILWSQRLVCIFSPAKVSMPLMLGKFGWLKGPPAWVIKRAATGPWLVLICHSAVVSFKRASSPRVLYLMCFAKPYLSTECSASDFNSRPGASDHDQLAACF